MADTENNPVFVVGSYRSGTSIFCWCLGQHPNLVNLPETNWLARLGMDLDNLYGLATVNGRYSHLGQINLSIDEFYRLSGEGVQRLMEATNPLLIERTEKHVRGGLHRRRSPHDPKRRWVDATPENSHYIYPLMKMFPQARFIHLLRSPHDVARSLLKFSRAGARDYANDEGYSAWTRLTRAALEGERALGAERMLRVRYEEFTQRPEEAFRRVLAFLGEDYCADCLKPLDNKINSSEVSPETVPVDDTTPAAQEAERVYQEALAFVDGVKGGDVETYLAMQTEFRERCRELQARVAPGTPPLPPLAPPGLGERLKSLLGLRA